MIRRAIRQFFSGLSLRRKLILLALLPSSVALLLVGSMHIYLDYRTTHERRIEHRIAQADLIAYNVTAALAFADARAAAQLLSALSAEKHIGLGVAYDREGALFADYRRPDIPDDIAYPQTAPAVGERFVEGHLQVVRPVLLDGERIGAVLLCDDLADMREHTNDLIVSMVVLLLFSGMIVAFLAHLLQGPIARPVARLIDAAQRVSRDKDYSLRLAVEGRDEMALLADAFNQMLTRIEQRDMQLQLHQEELEGEVAARTARLRELNEELTEAKERAEAASRLKSEFLANMSHEIRTPIHGILGSLDLVRGSGLDPERRDFIETAHTSAQQLLALINDILDFSKIEAGRLTLESEWFDIGDVMESACALVAPQATEKNLALHCLIPARIPARLRGDPTRLRQVLVNLLGNSVKFTERGEVTVSVEPVTEENGEVVLRFEVRDTGIGMSPLRAAELFQPFSQGDSTTTRRFGGTGLGLAICKRLVDLMGGEISVQSTPNEGATFHFTARLGRGEPRAEAPSKRLGLKVLVVDASTTGRAVLAASLAHWGLDYRETADADAARAALAEAAAGGAPFDLLIIDAEVAGAEQLVAETGAAQPRVIALAPLGRSSHLAADARVSRPVRRSRLYDAILTLSGRAPEPRQTTFPERRFRGRVLLAEDNRINQKVAFELLRRYGLEADLAADGFEALEALDRAHYDLVLMDLHMPRLDGLEATARIRQRETTAGGPRLPIVAVTADAIQGDRERCLAAGMDDYLSKPMGAADLERVLQRWLPESDLPAAIGNTESVDRETLTALHELLGCDFAELIADYLEDAPLLFARITDAVGQGDADALRNAAHSLKSSSANIGATALSAYAWALERLAREGAPREGEGLLAQTGAELEAVCEALAPLAARRVS